MRLHRRESYLLAVLAGAILVAVIMISVSINLGGEITEEQARRVRVVRDLASIGGLLGVLLAAVGHFAAERERRRNWALQRVKLAAELMDKFYEDDEFEGVRSALRGTGEFPHYEGNRPRLTKEVVRIMNLFEVLGLAVRDDCLDGETVDLMLGTPILEVANHPIAGQLVGSDARPDLLAGFSYDAYERYLYPAVVASRDRRKRAER